MFNRKKNFIFIFTLLTACSSESNTNLPVATIGIPGREYHPITKDRPIIYEIDIPYEWTCKEPALNDSLLDTTKPIYEFIIEDDEEEIYISIHNFPNNSIEERIPANAQINRWKQQFTTFEETQSQTIQQSFGGFAGLKFQGVGKIKEEDKMVVGWIMQLPHEHYYSLNFSEEKKLNEMCADYTIKVVGDIESVSKHLKAIEAAARSFRLAKEIPKSL